MKILIVFILTSLLLVFLFAVPTYAEDPFAQVCKGQANNSTVCKDKELNGANPLWGKDGIITNLINLMSIIAGIAAVIIIIVGGLRFVTGGNNPQEVQQARNLIIYAVVGLIIVASAQLIVRFFLSQL